MLKLKGKSTNFDSFHCFLNLREQQRLVSFLDCESRPRSRRLCGFIKALPFSPLYMYDTCHLYTFSRLISIQHEQNLDQITKRCTVAPPSTQTVAFREETCVLYMGLPIVWPAIGGMGWFPNATKSWPSKKLSEQEIWGDYNLARGRKGMPWHGLLPYLQNIICDQIYTQKRQRNKHKSHNKTTQHKPRSCSGAISEKSRQSNPAIGKKEIVRNLP